MNVGDAVGFIPGTDHALARGSDGQYPWVVGWVDKPNGPVKELTGSVLADTIKKVRRNPKAVVRNVNKDGTVNLDVKSNRGGVTLHCDNVLVDSNKAKGNSCHSLETIS